MATKTPLRITVLAPVDQWPEVADLVGAGHTIFYEDPGDADIIVGARCWRMTEANRPMLKLAIKAAQDAKKGGKSGTRKPKSKD